MDINYIHVAQQTVAERYPLIIYDDPGEENLPNGTIVGSWAYSLPGTARWILAEDLEIVPGVLPGDVARAYVADQWKLPIARRKDQIEARAYDSPLWARKGNWGRCGYVDVSKAFCTILQMGFDVEYMRNRYLGANPRPVHPQIRANKFCYSMCVSMSHSPLSTIAFVGNGDTFIKHPQNNFSNPCLYNLAYDVLSAIAAEIDDRLPGRVFYQNTDGHIVDCDYIEECQRVILEWGFSSKVKFYGDTEIWGTGSYRVGLPDSDGDHLGNMMFTDEYKNKRMTKDEYLWLKRRWQKFVHLFLSEPGFDVPMISQEVVAPRVNDPVLPPKPMHIKSIERLPYAS